MQNVKLPELFTRYCVVDVVIIVLYIHILLAILIIV